MEWYSKVLEELKVSDKNACKYLHLEPLTPKNNKILKLSFSENTIIKEYILVKTTRRYPDLSLTNDFNCFKNVVTPICSVDFDGASYAFFKEELTSNYKFQESFDLDHIVLFLKSLATFHSNFLSQSVTIDTNCELNFYTLLEKRIQNIESSINDKKVKIKLKLFQTEFNKILTQLKTTMDIIFWIPSLNSFDVNPIFFSYDINGKPVDFKVFLSNSYQYVPPLFDVLVALFALTPNELRKENFQELLSLYNNFLARNICDSEQLYFQIRSFIPLLKVFRCLFNMEVESDLIDWNIDEVIEFLHCPNLLREDCDEILKNYLKHSNYNFSLNQLQRLGSFGDYYKLKVEFSIDHKKQELIFFVKFLPTYNNSTNQIVKSGPSKKEDFFFNFLVKEFKSCGLKYHIEFAPKCLLSKINYVLVLEDLGFQGYQLSTDQNNFSYEMLSLTMKKLAHLHACSLVYEETKSKDYGRKFRLDEYYAEYLKEILFQTEDENELKQIADVGVRTVTDYLIYLYPEISKNMTMKEFHKRSKLAYKSFYTKHLKSDKYRNTFCHGDMWATNIMFKLDSVNFPLDCKLVDYQMTRYCPPAQDLLFPLYLTTGKETRTKHLTILLNEYYKELSKIVTSFGFDMEKVFPVNDFFDSCHYMTSQAVCQALLYAPINLTDVEDRESIFGNPENFEKIMKIDRRPFVDAMMKKNAFYKRRIGELVQELYNVCVNEQYK